MQGCAVRQRDWKRNEGRLYLMGSEVNLSECDAANPCRTRPRGQFMDGIPEMVGSQIHQSYMLQPPAAFLRWSSL